MAHFGRISDSVIQNTQKNISLFYNRIPWPSQNIENTYTRTETHKQGQEHIHKDRNTYTRTGTHIQGQEHIWKDRNTYTRTGTHIQGQEHTCSLIGHRTVHCL